MMESGPYENIPYEPLALSKGEEIRRPEILRRLGFEALFPRVYWYSAAPFARSIVPIELARAGDDQVIVHKRDEEYRSEPFVIDFLADLPGVESVVANRLVKVRQPLPHIRELFVLNHTTTVDQETLSNLPGLVSLCLGSGIGSQELELDKVEAHDWEADKLDLNVLRCMPGLRDLRFHALAAHSIEPVGHLEKLERLRIEGVSKKRNASPLAPLHNLRWMALDYATGLGSLKGLAGLERAELLEGRLTDLRPLKAWTKLQALALSGRGVGSLEGIAALGALEDLFLSSTRIDELAPLAGLPGLRRLRLLFPSSQVSFNPIGQIQNLQHLEILINSGASNGRIQSIDFVAGLVHLKDLEISGGVIEDGSLEPLFNLPDLRRVRLLGNFGDQVERLQRDIPDCDIQVTIPPAGLSGGAIQIDDLEIRRIEEDFWSIFQDLSSLLSCENNFDADRIIRHAIWLEAPDLFKRLEFDPDADFISIRARNEADIRQAAGIIQSLLSSRAEFEARDD